MNKFEHVLWGGVGVQVVVTRGGSPPSPVVNRKTDRQTRLKTLLSHNFVAGR